MNQADAMKLLRAAALAAKNAHAPYSKFQVGAALFTDDLRTFTGCNVENASYGLTICAERNAVATAVASGWKKFTVVAIVSSGAKPAYPCGACRQVLAEFCAPDTLILVASISKLSDYEETTLGKLLPKSFKL
jgi:cytidine deaminase